jgi:two-component system nitrogen regulation response regulator GlnG
LLTRHFLARSARELGVEAKRLSPEALKFIEALPFPGNVRQLENLCHWLTVLAPAQVVKVEDLPLEIRQESAPAPATAAMSALPSSSVPALAPAAIPPSVAPAPEQWRTLLIEEVQRRLAGAGGDIMEQLTREFESAVIGTALRHTHGRRIDAAAKLGVGRNTITRKVQDLGLED